MRKIGELSSGTEAEAFSDALFVRGIENDVDAGDDGVFSIWVHDDDQRDEAVALLNKFRAAPDAPEWNAAAPTAKRMKKEEERRDARRASHVVTRERMDYERRFVGFARIPLVLAIISVLVTIFAGELEIQLLPGSERAEREMARRKYLYITDVVPSAEVRHELLAVEERMAEGRATPEEKEWFTESVARFERGELWDRSLPEIRGGQFWRLFTPMFIHFGLLHIVFNLMWLRDLGTFVQTRFGGWYLLAFVLASAAVSNLVQLYLSGPSFGGMSGVNYALFGFLWMRGKYDRTALWRLNPVIVQTMLLWFVLCFTPLLGQVANGAHAAGLVFGMIAGFVTGRLASGRLRG